MMFIVISYDISLMDKSGASRLRRVARVCKNYGLRVQNSVFECLVDYSTYLKIKAEILDILNNKTDSVRFYKVGKNKDGKVEHFGAKPVIDVSDTLII